ncbi:hypothetical protein LWS74_13275, partial [Staphylococcus pasteuri]
MLKLKVLLGLLTISGLATFAALKLNDAEALAQELTSSAPASTIAKGEYLARAGDCIACHTAPEGKLFAGGRAMLTPFGTLYTSNITPDP